MDLRYPKLKFGILLLLLSTYTQAQEIKSKIEQKPGGLHGYISFNSSKPPSDFGFGISFYSAVWPLIDKPLANFQIGLPGSWVLPESSGVDFPLCPEGTLAREKMLKRGPTWATVFQTLEGGLGYWAGNRFRYGPPKFSMNATNSCYDLEIATPGWSFFYSATALPDDKMGIAQLSNRILLPPDGMTFIDNPDGKLLGYAWMALNFMDAKPGPPPTGEQSWTLFLNASNFKGPIAYYIPETWSKISKDYPLDHKRGLDARPGVMGGGAMEINTVPRMDFATSGDTTFYKIPKLFFPVNEKGQTLLVRDVKYYSKKALYDNFTSWRDSKSACSGKFDQEGTWEPVLSTKMPPFDQQGIKISQLESIFTTSILSENVFGMQWKKNEITKAGEFPQYFMQVGNQDRIPVAASTAPPALRNSEFKLAEWGSPYTSPRSGSWTTPGPASGPVEVKLSDGSTVTYYWYKFIDQPSFQQFNWSKDEKRKLQAFVEKIHKEWLSNQNYMAPPQSGELASMDPALIVKPPAGLEIGYVPIVTGQR